MKMKSKGAFLLVLVVVLLVVVSSRIAPEKANSRWPVRPTDDPYMETETPQPEIELPGTPPPVQNIRELLPDVSLSDWNLKLVNNYYVLGQSFAPDVTEIGGGEYFESRAAEHLLAMIAAAEEAGHTVSIRAAYRPYSTQQRLYNNRVDRAKRENPSFSQKEAEVYAAARVARPGTSEHQTGLAIDFNSVETDYGSTKAGKWLKQHANEYGFILRYEQNKQSKTGVTWEPWHYRFVGVKHAKRMTELGYCLEEYVDYIKAGNQ